MSQETKTEKPVETKPKEPEPIGVNLPISPMRDFAPLRHIHSGIDTPKIKSSDLQPGQILPAYYIDIRNNAYFTEYDNGNSGAAKTIDWTKSQKQKITMTGNCTFTFTAPIGSCNLILRLEQDGVGGRTAAWPSDCRWSGGSALSSTGSVDMAAFYWSGENYFGQISLKFVP